MSLQVMSIAVASTLICPRYLNAIESILFCRKASTALTGSEIFRWAALCDAFPGPEPSAQQRSHVFSGAVKYAFL
jgi:hypothetical protein